MSAKRRTWTVDSDGLQPGHFIVYRYRQPVGHLYINPRAIPLGLVAIREVVADMMLAASNPKLADELFAEQLDDDGW